MENNNSKIENLYRDFFDECKNYNRCNCNVDNRLVHNHALIITNNYYKYNDRLLIIGQEKKDKVQSKIYDYENTHLSGSDTQHWKKTMLCIYKFNNVDIDQNEINSYSYANINKLIDKKYKFEFAFTNFYKCAFPINNKCSRDLIHTEEMNHCFECLNNEIKYLNPTLIIFQGSLISEKFFKLSNEKYELFSGNQNKDTGVKMYKNCNDDKFIITSYHPSTRYWKKQKEDIYKFIDLYHEMRK